MAIRDQITDPIARAHMSKSRKRDTRQVTFKDRDIMAVLSPGWLPDEDYLDGLALEGIGELRDEHSRLLSNRDESLRAVRELQEKFDKEDADWAAQIEAAYAKGQDPFKLVDKRTPLDDRADELRQAKEFAQAATTAAYKWAQQALLRLRALLPAWEQAMDAENADVKNEIERLNARIDELKQELITDRALRHFIDRAAPNKVGQHVPFGRIETFAPPPESQAVSQQPMAQAMRRREMLARGLDPDEKGAA